MQMLGDKSTTNRPVLEPTSGLNRVAAITANGNHSLALGSNDTIGPEAHGEHDQQPGAQASGRIAGWGMIASGKL